MKTYPLLTSSDPPAEKILGRLGARVMTAIWEHHHPDEFTIRDVFTTMTDRYGYQGAYTTVMTTMSRLTVAGILERAPKTRSMHALAAAYACNYTESELIAEVCRRLTRE